MKWKRMLSGLLALVLCASMAVNVWAEDIIPCRLLSTGVSLTFVHYIEYEYNGKVYRSDETGGLTNYAAWQKMSDADKRKVTKWYAGFSSQLNEQFSGASDMQAFARDKGGWKQAGEVLRTRLAAANYPELLAFYGSAGVNGIPGELQLTDAVRAQLTAQELESYDAAANAYGILYRTGLDAYNKLIYLKQEQVNTAVTAISSGLIDIIMKYAIPPKPGELLDFAKDECKGYLKDYLGIEDQLKELVGIKKLTGEDKRIDSEKAAKAIELYWNLMCIQQKLAEFCMRKCTEQLSKVEELQASCGAVAARRETEAAAAEAARQQAYTDAVNAQVAQLDIDPEISVAPQGEEESAEDFNNRQLSAAKEWAKAEYDTVKQGSAAFWADGYAEIPADSPAHFNSELWLRWNGGSEAIAFYTEQFADYMALTGRTEYTLPGCETMLLDDPETLFTYYDYDKVLAAVYAGYDNVLAELESYEAGMLQCIAAREQLATDFRTGYQPFRNRVYSLVQSHCIFEDEGYGNWGIQDDYWVGFEDGYQQLCATLGQRAEDIYGYLSRVRAKIEEIKGYRAEYQRMQESFEAGLPNLYEFYAYSQDDLDYGLGLAIQTIEKLETLQASYPSWLKNHGYMFMNPIAGGRTSICTGSTGIESEELYQTFFKGKSLDERYAIVEDTLLPQLLNYQKQENELLADLEKARAIIKNASDQRTDPNNSGISLGKEWELKNLNKRVLGSLTIQNHIDMMKAFTTSAGRSYYDYLYQLDGAQFPKETPVLGLLIDDLRNESPYMDVIRTRHGLLLENLGDYLRQARDHTLNSAYIVNFYGITNAPDALRQDTLYRSYMFNHEDNLWYYWYNNIKPITQQISNINNGYGYRAVTNLSKIADPRVPSATPGQEPDRTLEIGQTSQLSVTVEPADATIPDVVWRSSDDTIATVSESGMVTALLPGTVTITATAVDSPSEDRISADFTVAVRAGECSSLEDLGAGFYLLAPLASAGDSAINVTARLGTNGSNSDGFLDATVVAAAYDGDRFLACSTQDCVCYNGELSNLSLSVPLPDGAGASLTVKVYLLEQDLLTPSAYYAPVVLNVS